MTKNSLIACLLLALGGCTVIHGAPQPYTVTPVPGDAVVATSDDDTNGLISHTLCLADGISQTVYTLDGKQAVVTIHHSDERGATAHIEVQESAQSVAGGDITIIQPAQTHIFNIVRDGVWVPDSQLGNYEYMGRLAQHALLQRNETCPAFYPRAIIAPVPVAP